MIRSAHILAWLIIHKPLCGFQWRYRISSKYSRGYSHVTVAAAVPRPAAAVKHFNWKLTFEGSGAGKATAIMAYGLNSSNSGAHNQPTNQPARPFYAPSGQSATTSVRKQSARLDEERWGSVSRLPHRACGEVNVEVNGAWWWWGRLETAAAERSVWSHSDEEPHCCSHHHRRNNNLTLHRRSSLKPHALKLRYNLKTG